MTLPIETDRLLIRRFTQGDVEDIYAFASDPQISKHLHGFPGMTIKEVSKYISQQGCLNPGEIGICFDLAVYLKSEKKVIGLVTLATHEHFQGEIGFALNAKYQRQGYAAEAVRAVLWYGFSVLNLHRVCAKTDRDNISSWLLLEKVGMRREGMLIHDHLDSGEWQDTFLYAVLAEEWTG